MTRIETFFAMGGYAAYIWPAFLITAVVLIGLAVSSRRALRHREATLAGLTRRAPVETAQRPETVDA